MEGRGGARAWPQVAGVGGHLLGSACVPGSLTHHLVFSHFVIISPSPSPPKVSLMNWSLRLSRELKPRVLRLAQVSLGCSYRKGSQVPSPPPTPHPP